MQKGGILSLIVYIIYTLLGAGLIIYSKVGIDDLNASGGGWEGLGLAIVLIVGIILGAAGLVATVIKLIHMKSGWLLFGILCILCDLVFIGAFISSTIPAGDVSQFNPADVLPVIPFIIASVASLVANIKSLRD
jgi:hypothetical protein